MRQSPKPCNQVQGEANPNSSPVRQSIRADALTVQFLGYKITHF
jgi:hypothetical protein